MRIKFKISKQDNEKLTNKYQCNIDWKLLSHSATSAFNWIKPNRYDDAIIIVRIRDKEALAGWYDYGQSLYINLDNNSDINDFIKTLFHEFRHWMQFKIEKRPAHSLVTKRGKLWDCDNAEEEATAWENIGEKIFDIYNTLSYIKEEYK